jgi:hypothetical protein
VIEQQHTFMDPEAGMLAGLRRRRAGDALVAEGAEGAKLDYRCERTARVL